MCKLIRLVYMQNKLNSGGMIYIKMLMLSSFKFGSTFIYYVHDTTTNYYAILDGLPLSEWPVNICHSGIVSTKLLNCLALR